MSNELGIKAQFYKSINTYKTWIVRGKSELPSSKNYLTDYPVYIVLVESRLSWYSHACNKKDILKLKLSGQRVSVLHVIEEPPETGFTITFNVIIHEGGVHAR